MKKVAILLILSIFLLPFTAVAHTTLTSSNPAEGELLAVQLEQIELIFGTVIEEGSTMTLTGPEETVELSGIGVSDNTMTGELDGELPNGQYTINWKIIGEDGHPIEGQILFGMDVEASQEESSEEAQEEAVVEEDVADTAENKMEETAEATESDEGSSNVWVTVFIVAAIILVAAGIFKLLKNKR